VEDAIPQSLGGSSETGRVLFIDGDNQLQQFDVVNKEQLKIVNLSKKLPYQKTKSIDSIFFENKIYTLLDNWVLEIWDLNSDNMTPLARIKLINDKDSSKLKDIIVNSYG
jgi:hypothetical protein